MKLDMSHCFHQFEIEEKARKWFTFRTPKGLNRFKRLVMGNNPASSECRHRHVSEAAMKRCEGVAQIVDDILVHVTEQTHERRLRMVLYRLQEAGFTLRCVKCQLGMTEVEWFGHRFSGAGMRVAVNEARIIP